MKRSMKLLNVLALGVVLLCAGAAVNAKEKAPVALDGHCAVCLVKGGKWAPGSDQYSTAFDGRTYLFPSEEELNAFKAAPEKFAPVLGGDCIVCYAEKGARVLGSVQHASIHDGRVYLFPSEKEKAAFAQSPEKYAKADLALGGACPVCKAMAGKNVPGKPEFTAVYDGLRYQFPSEKELQAFQADPTKFVPAGDGKGNASNGTPKANQVSIAGKTACAACSYGVRPIGAPESLGLAVVAADGTVYIVEGAEQNYPTLFKDRFEELPVSVTGCVIKKSDKFAWLEPSEFKQTD